MGLTNTPLLVIWGPLPSQVRAQAMQEVVLKDEDKMRKLQTELEKLQAHKETAQAQLKAVQVKGHLDGVSAGAPMSQVEHNQSVARYELKARPVASGLSHDTLAQTPGMLRDTIPARVVLGTRLPVLCSDMLHADIRRPQPTSPTLPPMGRAGARSTMRRPRPFSTLGTTQALRLMSTRQVHRPLFFQFEVRSSGVQIEGDHRKGTRRQPLYSCSGWRLVVKRSPSLLPVTLTSG